MLNWYIRVKFRAFGITFGTLKQKGSTLFLPGGEPKVQTIEVLNTRGVVLRFAFNAPVEEE